LILERLHPESLDQQLDFLAFHFDRSENLEKKRHYLEKAGKAAKSRYANAAAISYFERALPLLEDRQKLDTLLEAGNVWALLGNWSKADACFDRALTVARSSRDVPSQARCEAEKGDLFRKQGLCAEAATWLQQARSLFESVGDSAGVGKVLHTEGTVAAMVGDYEKAETAYRQSLALREKLGEKAAIGSLLSNLGILARYRGAAAEARRLMEESLSIRRDTGDRWAIGNSLNNLGVVLREMDEREAARQTLEESLALNRQVGDPWATANTLCSLAELAADECAWESAQASLEESLRINIDLADRITIAYILECFARVACGQGQPSKALMLASAASALRTTLNSPLSPAESERLDHYLEPARRALNPAEQNAANVQGHAMPFDQAVALALA
jgi:tetratricopeptide (TPR) repeat protein